LSLIHLVRDDYRQYIAIIRSSDVLNVLLNRFSPPCPLTMEEKEPETYPSDKHLSPLTSPLFCGEMNERQLLLLYTSVHVCNQVQDEGKAEDIRGLLSLRAS
jgi:hypothetical protein